MTMYDSWFIINNMTMWWIDVCASWPKTFSPSFWDCFWRFFFFLKTDFYFILLDLELPEQSTKRNVTVLHWSAKLVIWFANVKNIHLLDKQKMTFFVFELKYFSAKGQDRRNVSVSQWNPINAFRIKDLFFSFWVCKVPSDTFFFLELKQNLVERTGVILIFNVISYN